MPFSETICCVRPSLEWEKLPFLSFPFCRDCRKTPIRFQHSFSVTLGNWHTRFTRNSKGWENTGKMSNQRPFMEEFLLTLIGICLKIVLLMSYFFIQIVVGTPGRVLDLVKRGYLDLKNLKFFILDECDKMLL